MQIIKNVQGKLETTGSADEDAKSEATIRAQIAAQRAELRRMIEGNVQFFDDPMGKPVKPGWSSCLPSVPGVYIACTQIQAAGCFANPAAMDPLHYAYFNGSSWTVTTSNIGIARELYGKGWFSASQICWLYLVEAD